MGFSGDAMVSINYKEEEWIVNGSSSESEGIVCEDIVNCWSEICFFVKNVGIV